MSSHSLYKKRKPIGVFLNINGVLIPEVSEVKDLGIIIDKKLKFNAHIDSIVNRSAKMLGFLKRNTKEFRNPYSKTMLFNSLVRSILEYGSIIWNPSYTIHIDRIEKINKAFTRHLAFVTSGVSNRCNYRQRLEHFNIVRLKYRRIMLEVIVLHKILNNNLHCKAFLNKICFNIPKIHARFKSKKLFVLPSVKTNLGRHSPLYRTCDHYNNLINHLDLDIFCDSLPNIKKTLNKFFLKLR